MAHRTAVVYHPLYNGRGFSRLGRSWERYQLAMQQMINLGLLDRAAFAALPVIADGSPAPAANPATPVTLYSARLADHAELLSVHSEAHIQHVLDMDAKGEGFFDRLDTPAWHGVYRRTAMAVGGTILAAQLVASGRYDRVFHVAGGLHHAHRERVSGFCVFNDIVAAVRLWQNRYGFRRIAILDVDGHHGDGTQSLLYDEPVLTVSLHQYDGKFFPGTGSYLEQGTGDGVGYCLNLPLPRFATDAEYLPLLQIAVERIAAYKPEILLVQYGVDGHFSDRMVGLKLSTYLYEQVAKQACQLADKFCGGKLVVVGGGGYVPATVARCWGLLVTNLAGVADSLDERYQALHDLPTDLPVTNEEAAQLVRNFLADNFQIAY